MWPFLMRIILWQIFFWITEPLPKLNPLPAIPPSGQLSETPSTLEKEVWLRNLWTWVEHLRQRYEDERKRKIIRRWSCQPSFSTFIPSVIDMFSFNLPYIHSEVLATISGLEYHSSIFKFVYLKRIFLKIDRERNDASNKLEMALNIFHEDQLFPFFERITLTFCANLRFWVK